MPDPVVMPPVPGEQRLAALLAGAPADQAELVQIEDRRLLTRFAENAIHQNIALHDRTVFARCVVGRQVGVAATSDTRPEAVRRILGLAAEIARTLPPDESFPGLPPRSDLELPPSNGYVPATADCPAAVRAEGAAAVAAAAGQAGGEAAGIFETASQTVHVASTNGVAATASVSTAELAATVSLPDGRSGWAQAVARDVQRIAPEAVAGTAVAKATEFPGTPVRLESGRYTVLLEPAAVGQLLLFLGFMGFGARTVAQRRSFLKTGERLCSERITVREAPFAPEIYGLPVDYEGTVRKPVTLIDRGVAGTPVSNHVYAGVTGGVSTGHALPPDNSYGPYPKHMVMEPGETARADLLRGVERGILVTHFWYVNFLNPMRTMVTGTTRDGTFLIESGEPSARIADMRMEQSILEALTNVRAVENVSTPYRQYSVMMSVPALVVDDFNLVAEG